MKIYNLEDFKGGWVVGDFDPNIVRTKDFEFMVRSYKKGDKDPLHVHKVAYEITVFISGKAIMAGKEVGAGDIVYLAPGDESDFECLEDCSLAVIKSPSVIGDKYLL